MSPKRSLLRLALLSSLCVLSACALRPFYRQVLPPDVVQNKGVGVEQVTLRVVEPQTQQPISGARVVLTTGLRRFSATSDREGLLRLPVSPELLAENPLVEVILPKGMADYALQPVNQEAAPAQPSAGEPGAPATNEPAPQPGGESGTPPGGETGTPSGSQPGSGTEAQPPRG
jgi:hypothetical protein